MNCHWLLSWSHNTTSLWPKSMPSQMGVILQDMHNDNISNTYWLLVTILISFPYTIATWVKVFRIIPKFRISSWMLNSANYYRFSDLYSVCLKWNDHLSFKLWIFSGHIASFESSGFWKFWTFTHVANKPFNPFHAHYFYVLHSFPIFILLTRKFCSVYKKEMQAVHNVW